MKVVVIDQDMINETTLLAWLYDNIYRKWLTWWCSYKLLLEDGMWREINYQSHITVGQKKRGAHGDANTHLNK